MVIAACVAGGFSCTETSLLCSPIGATLFSDWGFSRIWIAKFWQLSNSSWPAARRSYSPRWNQSKTVNIARTERGEGERSSILAGFLLARIFERFAVLRFALRVLRPRVAICNSMGPTDDLDRLLLLRFLFPSILDLTPEGRKKERNGVHSFQKHSRRGASLSLH